MTVTFRILDAAPGVSLQDRGRPGYLQYGLSRGGAVDQIALAEGAALLGTEIDAALELPGRGGRFSVEGGPLEFALTGARMAARIGERDLVWNATHVLRPGEVLEIGGARLGSYGMLSLAGVIETPVIMGAKGAHLRARIGRALTAGDSFEVGPTAPAAPRILAPGDRLSGGTLRIVASAQTALFSQVTLDRLLDTKFRRGQRGNRMGLALDHDGEGFAADNQLSVLSEIVTPGDIQMTGDGTPFILGPECQTTGGYPRIATVIPSDMPRAFQAQPGAPLTLEMIDLETAIEITRQTAADLAALGKTVRPRLRDPHDMADLLSYQLISGVTLGEPS